MVVVVWHTIDVQQVSIIHPSFLTSSLSFSVFLVSFPWIFKRPRDPDGKIHLIWVTLVDSWICKINFTCVYRKIPSHQQLSLNGHSEHFPWVSDGGRLGVGKLRAQIRERAEGRERNQLGYFPGLICYLPALARIVLWPRVTGIVTVSRG